MNWFDNVSSDCDQPIAPARLMHGHWLYQLNPHADPVLCRVVMDVAEPRVVAAQVIEHGIPYDLGSTDLEDLSQTMLAQEVHLHPQSWGMAYCEMLPSWARPSFSDQQIEELQRIEGYLIEASEENLDNVLKVRDEFLKGIGITDRHMYRAVRESPQSSVHRKNGRSQIN